MKTDIFVLKETYPLPDDDHTETFEWEGQKFPLTLDRVVTMTSNVLAGHHPMCETPDCPVVSDIAMCRVMGPAPKVDVPPPPWPEQPHRSVGFDIDRGREQ